MEVVLLIINMSLVGAALGAFTGIAPGVHVNTLALGVLMTFPLLNGGLASVLREIGIEPDIAAVLLASMLISASVVHSFLDFIPSVLFGAPEEEESMSVLPGHRLLLSGRSMEAISCAASGSLIGAMGAIIASLPIVIFLRTFPELVEQIDPFIPGLLLCTAVLLIVTQRDGNEAEWTIMVHGCDRSRVSICRPVPVDGRKVTMTGHVKRGRFGSKRIIVTGNSWKVRGKVWIGDSVTVEGEWRVRRRRWLPKGYAFLSFLMAGVIGLVAMNGRPPGSDIFAGLDGNLLFPMLAGLFAMPALIGSSCGAMVPEQDLDVSCQADRPSALKGVAAGLFAAWVPGVTATTGTVIGDLISTGRTEDDDGPVRFISMTASIGTAATVFGIASLTATGGGGTGVLIAVGDMVPSDGFEPLAITSAFLLSALIASLAGYVLTMWCGKRMAARVSGSDASRSSMAIILLETVLVATFTGVPGLIVLVASTAVGLVPPMVGVSRVTMTGCLILPLLLSYFHLSSQVLCFLGG